MSSSENSPSVTHFPGKAKSRQTVKISPIEAVIDAYRQGKMVIIVDDEDRENEGDLFVAAQCAEAEHINFMAREGRGLICLTLNGERCEQLKLPLMVASNGTRYGTNFTVSIEAARGVTTGISAADRAATVRAAAAPGAGPEDIVSPGHIFPIRAEQGGVLTRAGHTEAGVDLARLAGFEPASVICEVLNPDGTMARLSDLLTFAEEHGLLVGTIADLIRYRLRSESTVHRVAQYTMDTLHGSFEAVIYEDDVTQSAHLALYCGEIDATVPVPVRVHVHTGPLDSLADACGPVRWTVGKALARIAANGSGAVVILDYNEDANTVEGRIRSLSSGIEQRSDEKSQAGDLRMVGAGSQILADLGAGKVVVLGTPMKTPGLSGFGLEVVDYQPLSDGSPSTT